MSNYPSQLTNKLPTTFIGDLVGRDDDLADVKARLFDHRQVLLVNGIGGVGKTTLAQAYVGAHADAYQHIAWINCLSDDFPSDVIQTAGLLQNLRINPTSKDIPTLYAEIMRGLHRLSDAPKPNLLIIDNAEAGLLRHFDTLPKPPAWHILATSRERIERFQIKPLDFLNPQQAVQLFIKHYTRDINSPDTQALMALLKAVDFHTLTIEILAKTAQKQRIPIPDLLQAFHDDRKANVYIPHADDHIERITSYLVSIFNLSRLSPDELWLMQQFTCLPPDFHDYDTLLELMQPEATKRSDIFSGTLVDLVDKGWLLSKGDGYKMHRVIGEVIRRKKSPTYNRVAPLFSNVSEKLAFDNTSANPSDYVQWIPFGERMLHHFRYSNLSPIATLQDDLGMTYYYTGKYERAKTLLEEALEADERNYGKTHPRTAIRCSNLSIILQELGNYERAIELLETAVKSDLVNFGENDERVTIRFSNLAMLLSGIGDSKSAKKLLEKAITLDERNGRGNEPKTIVHYSNLAQILRDIGDIKKARKIFEKVTKYYEQNFGEEHPNTAISYSNLATVLEKEEFLKAKKMLEKGLSCWRNHFGEQHPNIANFYHKLSAVYYKNDDIKNALHFIEKAYKIHTEHFGKEHSQSKFIKQNLDIAVKEFKEKYS